MSFLAWERWVAVNRSIQVTCADVLDLSSTLNVSGANIWKLDPILKKVVIDPVNKLVDTLTTALLSPVGTVFFS